MTAENLLSSKSHDLSGVRGETGKWRVQGVRVRSGMLRLFSAGRGPVQYAINERHG